MRLGYVLTWRSGPDTDTDVSKCGYILRGVSGGAHLYYDDAKLDTGEFQRCYTYATILGHRHSPPKATVAT